MFYKLIISIMRTKTELKQMHIDMPFSIPMVLHQNLQWKLQVKHCEAQMSYMSTVFLNKSLCLHHFISN